VKTCNHFEKAKRDTEDNNEIKSIFAVLSLRIEVWKKNQGTYGYKRTREKKKRLLKNDKHHWKKTIFEIN